MSIWHNYHLAYSVDEALQLLVNAPESARVIAGGTDFLLDLQQGRHPPVHTLVDITNIPELNILNIHQERMIIGAARPLNQIVSSPLVNEHAPALVEACRLIGGPQVRNTATLGGNVAHALPAGDGTIALLALDAQAEVASLQGRYTIPMSGLFVGPGRSKLDPRREILVGFWLPLSKPGQSSAFRRVMRPQGVAIAILNMAIWLQRKEGRIDDIRISLGPAGAVPMRAVCSEQVLRGHQWNQEIFWQACECLLSEASFRTSPHRATAEYRRHVACILLEETISAAWKRISSN